MKNLFLKKVPMLCVILMLVLCIGFSGCASRHSVTAEEFSAACETAGYTLEDVSAQFDPATFLTALNFSDEENSIAYFSFASTTAAKSNYAQMISSLKTGAAGEKFVDSAEYNRFFAADDGHITLLYRNGTTLIFIIGTDTENLQGIIDTLKI